MSTARAVPYVHNYTSLIVYLPWLDNSHAAIAAHAGACVALAFFIFDAWSSTLYWWIFAFCRWALKFLLRFSSSDYRLGTDQFYACLSCTNIYYVKSRTLAISHSALEFLFFCLWGCAVHILRAECDISILRDVVSMYTITQSYCRNCGCPRHVPSVHIYGPNTLKVSELRRRGCSIARSQTPMCSCTHLPIKLSFIFKSVIRGAVVGLGGHINEFLLAYCIFIIFNFFSVLPALTEIGVIFRVIVLKKNLWSLAAVDNWTCRLDWETAGRLSTFTAHLHLSSNIYFCSIFGF